jgi:hypothetical protein
MKGLHTVKITVPDGEAVLSRVEIDGEPLMGVTAVSFDLGIDRTAQVTLRLYADLLIEGEAQIVKEWRQGLPWWRRLPYWLGR